MTTDVKWVTMSSRVNSYARESGNKKEQIITNKQTWPRGWSEGNSEVSFCLSSLLIARLHSIFACIKILKRSRIFLGIHYPLAFRTKHLFAMSRCMKLFYENSSSRFFYYPQVFYAPFKEYFNAIISAKISITWNKNFIRLYIKVYHHTLSSHSCDVQWISPDIFPN